MIRPSLYIDFVQLDIIGMRNDRKLVIKNRKFFILVNLPLWLLFVYEARLELRKEPV